MELVQIIGIIAIMVLPTMMAVSFFKEKWDKKKKQRRLKKENRSMSDFLGDWRA